jgi:EmrB/QacA subfamily drug resistance transporter
MSGKRLYVITATMMLSLFLASVEATIVATAMPTIVAELGGLAIYSWAFAAFQLSSTTAIPILGKLSDIYGRRPIYLISVATFVVGSALCGFATSMEQLVIFRLVQGLGAGGIMPLAFTIIGDIFSFEQRAKIQGVFSGVWGVSSVIGPLVGGFLVDKVNWHWVFFFNIPFGFLAMIMMIAAWRDVTPRTRAQVDYAGAGLLAAGIVMLLLALSQLNEPRGWGSPAFWIESVIAVALLTLLVWVERRTINPIFPIPLFRDRLFTAATGHGLLSGFALFGTTAFIPFFAQSVLGVSATAAGATLTPQLISWVIGSIISSRLLLRYGYRSIAMVGVSLLVVGSAMMTQVSAHIPLWYMYVAMGICGLGMGFTIPSFTIAVQSSVARQSMGTATSMLQFSRNIGGAIGVSVLGVALTLRLDEALTNIGLDPKLISVGQLLDPTTGASESLAPLRDSLASAVQLQFLVAFLVVLGAWIATSIAPRGRIATTQAVGQESAGQPASE